jgi:hypothetical protein
MITIDLVLLVVALSFLGLLALGRLSEKPRR